MIGYMCSTDFDYHLTGDARGTRVYACREDLEADRPCVKQCGITEVEVRMVRRVTEPNFDDAKTPPAKS